jgi:hypothetical protein
MVKKLIVVFAALIFSSATCLAYIIDTGKPPIPSDSIGWSYHSNPSSQAWLSGKISLTGIANITAIKIFMTNKNPGNATITIYADGGEIPDVSRPLFSQNFDTTGDQLNAYGWYGISSVNWNLNPGTYWVAFEARYQDNFYSGVPWSAPNPLADYAVCYNMLGQYSKVLNLDFGLRISGSISPPVRYGIFSWPVDPSNLTKGHYGECNDWVGIPNACFWISDSSEKQASIWRDVQPFQMHRYVDDNRMVHGYHIGADYNLGGGAKDKGLPVYPIAEGIISAVKKNVCGWGNIIFIRHETSIGIYTSMYAHVSWLNTGPPKEGLKVHPNKSIALIGNGEWTKGQNCTTSGHYPYHLHFEVREGVNTIPGTGYSKEKLGHGEKGLQGQIDPNYLISNY